MKLKTTLLATLALTTLSQADPLNDQAKTLAQEPIPDIIRAVLDGRPRMLAVKLDPHTSIAYDTWHALLGTAWKTQSGPNIKFDGAVYNGSHGPQPTRLGKVTFDNKTPEFTTPLGTLHYLGHSILKNQLHLRYGIRDKDNNLVATITETPTYTDGTLTRKITVSPQTQGQKITLTPAPQITWKTNGKDLKTTTLAAPVTITTSL